MSNSSATLRQIFNDARPLVEQALDLSEQFAAFRELATQNGLDWSQIKALLKAEVQDERAGDGNKRVDRIIEKADFASAYADMLGLGTPKMNENNFSAAPVDRAARSKRRLSEAMDDNKALSAELQAAGLISDEAHAENVRLSDGVARKLGAGVIDPETGEILDEPHPAAGAAEQGLGDMSRRAPGPDLSQSGEAPQPPDAPVERSAACDQAPGAPFPSEANGWAGLEPPDFLDRSRISEVAA